ncbi:MAG: DUF433 domain-containing protein [Phycisphaerae bacterium]|nr:DUF433 domain-containing protein [Phycisphaerae bacterium]
MSVVVANKNIQGGAACFGGTRVPIEALFDYLEKDHTAAEFLADFPTVSPEQVRALLEAAKADLQLHAEQAITQ